MLVRHLRADQNASLARNVLKTGPAPIKNAEIPAPALVASTPFARSSTTIRSALVRPLLLEIRLQDAPWSSVSRKKRQNFFLWATWANNLLFSAPTAAAPRDPCRPSPCGPFSQCRAVGDNPSCSCLPGFIGNPPACKPECVSNAECSINLACINQKCRDPCPGSCGSNAQCRVASHTPNCYCLPGYFGDPFTQCFVQQGIFKKRVHIHILI